MNRHTKTGAKGTSIRDQLRLEDVIDILFETNPFPFNLLAMPYNLFVYNRILQNSKKLWELRENMMKERECSKLSALCLPSYSKASEYLKIKYEIL